MNNLTVQDICNYIDKCIEDKRDIYINWYGGFCVKDEISVQSCNYTDLKEITIKIFESIDLLRVNDPAYEIRIKDYSEEEWLNYQSHLLKIKRYNENNLYNLILNGRS